MRVTARWISAAVAAVVIAGSSLVASTAADARPFGGGGFRGGHHGGYHGGFRGRGFGLGAGIATGLAIGGLGYGYGYGYPSYGANYAYNDFGGCYLQRRVFVNRFGYRVVRPVRVCV